MHPIQNHILKQLISGDSRRFKELKPLGTESNQFVYHLNKLIGQKYVLKISRGYKLASAGKLYIDKLSLKTFFPRFQPKIVTLVICQNSKGEVLVTKQRRQPFFDLLGFPYGKIHFGESIYEAAKRELKEKTNLDCMNLKHCGDAYLTIKDEGEIVSHMLCHVFKGQINRTQELRAASTVSVSWLHPSKFKSAEFIPGILKIFGLTKTKKRSFEEILA